MPRFFLLLAAFNGLLAVLLGAFGVHGLQAVLSPARLDTWATAVQYQMFHVAALAAVAFALSWLGESALLYWSGMAFFLGILLFSGSLYLLALLDLRWLGMVTPGGGVAFLAGWSLLIAGLLRHTGARG